MSRLARRNLPGGLYHVISRFVDRRWELRDAEERATYLRMFGAAISQSDWRCLGYALMSSHLHFALLAGEQSMSGWTKAVHSPFAAWLNRRHRRLGPVFASRPRDYGFALDRTGSLLAYIHNNPVRAGVVAAACESDWTSHRAYAGHVEAPQWLWRDTGMQLAGIADPSEFDAWVNITPGERCDARIERHRSSARKLGLIEFASPNADGNKVLFPLVVRPYAHVRPPPRSLVEFVAAITRVDVDAMCSRQRRPTIASARAIAVHAGSQLGLTPSQMAAALGVSAQAVHKISKRVLSDSEVLVVDHVVAHLTLRHQQSGDS